MVAACSKVGALESGFCVEPCPTMMRAESLVLVMAGEVT